MVRRVDGPLVVAGDFNATPWSLHLATFERLTGLTRLTGLPSWPARGLGLPQVAIDHIFVSSGMRPLGSATTLDASGSDHLPVRVTLAVRQP
jgi:endonuclease/exonuclease/phosphatase (EEP) superfamily protein YafD